MIPLGISQFRLSPFAFRLFAFSPFILVFVFNFDFDAIILVLLFFGNTHPSTLPPPFGGVGGRGMGREMGKDENE